MLPLELSSHLLEIPSGAYTLYSAKFGLVDHYSVNSTAKLIGWLILEINEKATLHIIQ